MKIKKLKKKFKKDIRSQELEITDYKPKLFGDSKSTSFEMSGLIKSFCMCTEWSNGEGFDFSFELEKGESKRISLHSNEINIMLACLNRLNYFGDTV